MRALRSSFAAAAQAAIVSVVLLAAVPAAGQTPVPSLTVGWWGQSEINENGNLRFQVTSSAGGIQWSGFDPAPAYLQLWAHIQGVTNATDVWVLVKSKSAINANGQPATGIAGTSTRVKLSRGTYTYSVVVMLSDTPPVAGVPPTPLIEVEHVVGRVTLP